MATRQGDEPIADKHLVIVGDNETGQWSILAEASDKASLKEVLDDLKDDPSPTIVIYTGDYIQV